MDPEEHDVPNSELAESDFIIIYLCCCIVGLISNICIVCFTIRRNVKSVLQTYYLMFTITIAFELITIIGLVTIYRYDLFYYLHSILLIELSLTLELTELLFILVMCLIWFLALNNRTFKGHFKIVLSVIFLIVFIYYTTIVIGCVYEHLCTHATDWDVWCYLVIFIVIAAMHMIKCVFNTRNSRTTHTNNFILIVITLYMICWLPHTMLTLFYSLKLRVFHPTEYILAGCLGCLYSFFNLLTFIILYKNWRMRFVSLFRCNTYIYTRTDDNLSDSAQNVSEVTTI